MLGEKRKKKVKILLLPKFEIGEMTGDTPGEAQLFYEAYLAGGTEYSILACPQKFYFKNGIGLFLPGAGKVNCAIGLTSLLSDERFDFSSCYIFSIGCGGGAIETAVMGDVFIMTTAVDGDLGHNIDIRDIPSPQKETTWFHDRSYDEAACIPLNKELAERAYQAAKDVPLQTTPRTREMMQKAFPNEEWAIRNPCLQKGTVVTADNYWKGLNSHNTAKNICEVYGCPDPFVLSEMEDVSVANVVSRFGYLSRFLCIRVSVNTDVFMFGDTPEKLWPDGYTHDELASEESKEASDIFLPAMLNEFNVVSTVMKLFL